MTEQIPLVERSPETGGLARSPVVTRHRETSHDDTLAQLEGDPHGWGFRRTPSKQEREALERERTKNRVAWSKSPFRRPKNQRETVDAVLNDREIPSEYVRRHSRDGLKLHINIPDNVNWIDLLLEIAMATAFASLADNTPILTGLDVWSFVAFFALVWWIWASQVAYNMRFRQADWFHRFFAFCQLAIFSGMAAFTNQFDISGGLVPQLDVEEAEKVQIELNRDSLSVLQAQNWRSRRLPTLNARGIAIVMTISRVSLLVQYVAVFVYAKGFHRDSIIMHMLSLCVSAMLFFSSYWIIGHDPTKSEQIAKVAFWYTAILLEIAAHYVANRLPGRANYSPKTARQRMAFLFIIVLGTGLDKITNSFRYVVGTLGFGWKSVAVLTSVAIIVVGLFGSYFSVIPDLPKQGRITNARILTWFFLHFPFLAFLIVLLQGIVRILAFTNLKTVVNELISVLRDIKRNAVVNTLAGKTFGDADRTLRKLGVSLDHVLESIPQGQDHASPLNATDQAIAAQSFLQVYLVAFGQLDALPEPNTILQAEVDRFMAMTPNTTFVTLDRTTVLIGQLLEARITPIRWFGAAIGGALLMLAILMRVRRIPRDRWEFRVWLTWVFSGIICALTALLNIGASGVRVNWEDRGVVYRVSSLILPIFAFILVVTNGLHVFFERLALREAKKRRQPTEATEIDLRETLQIYVDTYGRHSFNPWYHPVDPTDADEDDDDDSKRTKQ